MVVIRGSELQVVETPGGNSGGLATPSRGAAEVSIIRQRQVVGAANPTHTHDREEVTLVLTGNVTITVADEAQVLNPGDAVIVPARTPHHVENTGVEAAEWLIVSPAGVRFFHADGQEAIPSWAQ